MRRETENGNFDRPCFVQTVYLRTLLTEVASEGWNKPAYSVGLKCARLMSGCVHTVTQDRDTTDWRRARNLVKLAELFRQCVYKGTTCRPTRRGERWV